MRKIEVIIGKVISLVVLITTIIFHKFVSELNHVIFTCLVSFSALLYTLCVIGDKRKKQKGDSNIGN